MNVYVESNFVLELALLQEQHASCEEVLRLSEIGSVYLVIPAYSIAEPYETLVRRHKQRKRMKAELDDELRQLARTTAYAQRLSGFQNLTVLLIDSADEEAKRLEEVQVRLLKAGEVIPLEALTLTSATQYQRIHGLSPPKDFDDPDLVEELNANNCKLLAQFDAGYQFILSRLSQDTEPV